MSFLPVRIRRVARRLGRAPLFTAIAVLTLALGIGANTAIFTVVRGVLLKPLPFPEPDRLVGVWHSAPGMNFPIMNQSPATYLNYREENRTFEDIAMWDTWSVSVTGVGEPERIRSFMVADGMLPILRVEPVLGRRFTADDMQPGAAPTIVLGDDFARTRYPNGDAVGQTIIVDGRATAIIGVLPEGFRFPASDPDFWQPLTIDRATSNRSQSYLRVMGRLAPGTTPDAAVEQMNAVALDLE